jgi:hypothetical protein
MKELVGKGKPFYSAVDKAAGLLKRKVGTGAEFMKELMALQGIKQSEIAERGLGELMGAPKMTHEQFMQALAAKPAPAIHEKILDVGNTDDPRWLTQEERNNPPENLTHHENYTLPGGKNYREMLIKAPAGVDNQEKIMEMEAKARRIPMINSTPEQQAELTNLFSQIKQLKDQEREQKAKQFSGVSGHFGGEGNILASMRLKDRTAPGDIGFTLVNKQSGNKSQLYNTAEEAQAAMQKMPEYLQPFLAIQQSRGPDKKLLHLEELQSDWHQQGREKGYGEIKKPVVEAYYEDPHGNIIPVGFGRTKEEADLATHPNWKNSVNIKYRNYDQVLGHGVPEAPFKKNWEEMALKRLIHHAAEKGYHGIVVTPGAEQADRYSLAKHIDELIYSPEGVLYGAQNGKKVINEKVPPEKLAEYVGKETADKLLSAKENEVGSKVLTGQSLQVGGEGMKGFYDKKVPNILNSIGKKYGVKTELHAHPIPKGVSDFNPNTGETNPNQPQAQLHHFPITEEMRKDVLTNGLPLHREGGIIHKAVGGTVQPSINQMRAELVKKMPTSLADLSSIGANEAPSMNIKAYVPPAQGGDLPVGGIDMNDVMQGIQFMPQESQAMQAPQQPQGALQGQPQGQPSPLSAGASRPQPPSNILQMTPQGQALNAMTPPQAPARMAVGGSVPMPYKIGGSDNMPPPDNGWKPDNGVSTFNIDNVQQAASGGSIEGEDNSTVMTHDHGYADGGLVPEEMEPPKKTVKAYKLFRVHKKHPGKLFPLFVNADKPVEMDKWQQAEIGEMAGKKVKSKIGPLAFRPGWHAGDLPIATHIGEKDEEQKMEQARIRELRNKAVKKHGDKKLANQTYPYPEWTNAPLL